MKALLDNRFAPVTFRWGFIESPLAEVSLAFIRWQGELKAKFGTRTEHQSFRSPLSRSLNRIRSVTLTNDVGGWEFTAEGEVQPYELTENYGNRKITDRFTPKMLESYCAALGIELFNPDFYGEQSLLVHIKRESARGPAMSIAEARSHVHI
jgi:hypothetical protein